MRVLQKPTIGSSKEVRTNIFLADQIAFSYRKKAATITEWYEMVPTVYVFPSGENVVLDLHFKTSEDEETFERWNIDFFDIHSLTNVVTFHICGHSKSDAVKLSDVLSLYLWEEE